MIEPDQDNTAASSFRDPSGFVFYRGDVVYRQVNSSCEADYRELMASGLYDELVSEKLLIPHRETDELPEDAARAYKVIKPERIPFISYPYEWCFSQLKDAALTTLRIQETALSHGMSLKDASAYNIQFLRGRPVLIDTLSFERYRPGEPWVAYRQFCQHFLAPLALMSYVDLRLSQLLKVNIDGIPLDLAARLLPARTRFRFSLLVHLHLHARSQKHYADKTVAKADIKGSVSKRSLLGMVGNLQNIVRSLNLRTKKTEWGDYYADTNYTDEALNHKKELVERFVIQADPGNVWDIGANDGTFSRIASGRGIPTTAFDIDPVAVERNYTVSRRDSDTCMLPLIMDLTNPSPAIGWNNRERDSLPERGPADLVIALALVHHLAISNNVPLGRIADYLQQLTRWLIIEFIPKDDSQVQRLLSTREDIFTDYTQDAFEQQFCRNFDIIAVEKIRGSRRVLYLMQKKAQPG